MAILLHPGDDVQSIINSAPDWATFEFTPGVYHGLSLTPRSGQTFIGDDGAVLDGATVLDDWQQTGANQWSVFGLPDQIAQKVMSDPWTFDTPPCEQLFVNGVALHNVNSVDQLTPNSWYFDSATNSVVLGFNPGSNTVEYSTTPVAFTGYAYGVTLQNITVTHYASPLQQGAIFVGGDHWTLTDVHADNNSAAGITVEGDNVAITGGTANGNGQIGVRAWLANNLTITGVEAAGNNSDGVINTNWEAGGIKIVESNNVTINQSYVHNNGGKASGSTSTARMRRLPTTPS